MTVRTMVDVAGIKMKNPVTTAAGTFGNGEEYARYVNIHDLGALCVKTLTLEPHHGNPPPRIAETPGGILNAVGLQNPGIDYFLEHNLPWLLRHNIPVIVSIAGSTVEEYALLAAKLTPDTGIAGVEVNISCPNVKAGGIAFGSNAEMAADVISAVRQNTSLPVIAKLSPNVTDIKSIALSVCGAGADAVSLINTVLGLAIDPYRRKPVLANIFGGLSGPAIKPIALRAVWQVYEAVEVPIIGMGGITTALDAIEFILAGATAVAVGTTNFINPRAASEIITGIYNYLQECHIPDIKNLIGAAHRQEVV
ncbi:MAG: dihydroorotate dehydrogenase [Peptococcaceae bacterium]|nr:dihydroorotate dehydrogenase [Peptococcaceae bacterium]